MTKTQELDEILGNRPDHSQYLIPVLQEIQTRYRYLPEEALRIVSRRLHVPLTKVFHVATFYNCFSLEPAGEHVVQVCMGTACHVRGAPRVLDRVLQDLRLALPGTTKDLDFTVNTVRCIGCCGLAPVVRVDSANVHPHMTQAKVSGLLKRYRAKKRGEGSEVA